MRVPWVLALVAGAGCAQLFGIKDTSGGSGDAALGDGNANEATLAWQRMSVGAKVVRAPQDLSTSMASFLEANGSATGGFTRIPTTVTAPGTWSAPIPTGAPPSYFTLPDVPTPIPRLYDLGVRNSVGLYAVLKHPSPQPMPTAATLQFNLNLAAAIAAGYSAQEYSLGSWTQYGFPVTVGQAAISVNVPCTSPPPTGLTSLNGEPLSAFTTDDVILGLEYNANTLIGAYIGSGFAQTGSDTVSGTMQAVAQDQNLSVTVDAPSGVPTRYTAVRPATTLQQIAWFVNAAPASNIGNSGPQLNAVGLGSSSPAQVTGTYGNPFTSLGWDAVFLYNTYSQRSFTPAGQTLAATLYSQLYTFALPTAGATVPLAAGLPITISINGSALVTDGTTVTINPSQAVDISFQADQPTCSIYQMQLFDLLPNTANTALQYTQVFGATGIAADFKIPPDPFVSGHTYTLRAVCLQGGFPTLASGDLTNRALPLSVGYSDSGVFTVSP